MGVGTVGEGGECLRGLRSVEQEVGRRVDALISAEIGGANYMEPMLTAAQAGLPVVDGDGMGRAFPEMQMITWSIYGQRSTPAAMADEKGNQNPRYHEVEAQLTDEAQAAWPARPHRMIYTPTKRNPRPAEEPTPEKA